LGPKWRPPKVGGHVQPNTSNVPKAGSGKWHQKAEVENAGGAIKRRQFNIQRPSVTEINDRRLPAISPQNAVHPRTQTADTVITDKYVIKRQQFRAA